MIIPLLRLLWTVLSWAFRTKVLVVSGIIKVKKHERARLLQTWYSGRFTAQVRLQLREISEVIKILQYELRKYPLSRFQKACMPLCQEIAEFFYIFTQSLRTCFKAEHLNQRYQGSIALLLLSLLKLYFWSATGLDVALSLSGVTLRLKCQVILAFARR